MQILCEKVDFWPLLTTLSTTQPQCDHISKNQRWLELLEVHTYHLKKTRGQSDAKWLRNRVHRQTDRQTDGISSTIAPPPLWVALKILFFTRITQKSIYLVISIISRTNNAHAFKMHVFKNLCLHLNLWMEVPKSSKFLLWSLKKILFSHASPRNQFI